MIKNVIFVYILILSINNFVYSDELDCSKFKKFSMEYITCNANLVKDKTVSVGKNFVEDTKNYQKKEWSEEKVKVDQVKQKVLGE